MKIKNIEKAVVYRPDATPDVDLDFEAARRDDVKRYFKFKYGEHYVCNIGAYDRLKLRSSLKDFGKVDGLSFKYRNFVTKQIANQHKYEWGDLFKYAAKNRGLEEFAQANHKLVNKIKHTLNQAKNGTIHASAMIIVPKHDEDGNPMEIYDWMPVKKMKDSSDNWILVSEWEGKYIDSAGFLKEDILGLTQLDKFHKMLDLIKEHYNEEIVLEDIPLDDPVVYEYYSQGWVEDIFQFSGDGLRAYCKSLQPDDIENLIAANALYRPGPMSSNAHKDYVKILRGRKKAKYDFGLKEVTEATVGLYIYQEQIMKSVHVLGGLSLSEADEVRTVMKKFDKAKMLTFAKKFISGAIENGCSESEAVFIWEKLERFSGYGFNRSHAAAYSIMSYWSMWLKVHYPLAFWVAAFQFSSDDSIPYRIFEMKKINKRFEVVKPNVNESTETFVPDVENNQIFWSLIKIKGIGGAMVSRILEERKNGKFKNLKNFLRRMKGKGFGKDKTKALICAGAFDDIYGIEDALLRKDLLIKMHKIRGEVPPPELYTPEANELDYWILQQKNYTGLGEIDYEAAIGRVDKKLSKAYRSITEISNWDLRNNEKMVAVAGFVDIAVERDSKRGKWCSLKIRGNTGSIDIILWNESWEKFRDIVTQAKDKKKQIAVYGRAVFDSWRETNAIHSHKNTKVIAL